MDIKTKEFKVEVILSDQMSEETAIHAIQDRLRDIPGVLTVGLLNKSE